MPARCKCNVYTSVLPDGKTLLFSSACCTRDLGAKLRLAMIQSLLYAVNQTLTVEFRGARQHQITLT